MTDHTDIVDATKTEPSAQAIEPKPVNDEGSAPCLVRWIVETPKGWIGSWDKSAFSGYAAMLEASNKP